jgi:3-phosphoshikimate 1-carboxyvinyltransferase
VHQSAVTIPRSKSVLNRQQIIADLHPDCPTLNVIPDSADTLLLQRGLPKIGTGQAIDVGDGGTTLRFLLARAALSPKPTLFQLSSRLYERPHTSLIESLQRGGATIEMKDAEKQIHVVGWPKAPHELQIEARTSSQYASALALLAASGMQFSLVIEGPITSSSYLDLTLNLLEKGGVSMVRKTGEPLRIDFLGVSKPASFETPQDESSAAIWRCLAILDPNIESPAVEDSSQPDASLSEILNAKTSTLHIEHAPDLFPVLVTTHCVLGNHITIDGGPTLRIKESDRVADLATQLIMCGGSVVEGATGITTNVLPYHSDERVWTTCKDHRLAFAALLASLKGPLRVRDPQVVLKSYPRFWQDARALGWSVLPLTFPLEHTSKQA